jgi:2-aminophenol/2-amino-5-chlorophenol 1,6-dioxygenase subunit beta
MAKGQIIAGVIAPHPPHLVYAENPPQNEPSAECGWETLRWGYERLRKSLERYDYDSIIIFSPHWQTYVGTHFLGVKHFKNISVDPIFPNLFRYHYELDVDVELAEQIAERAAGMGLQTKMMRNPDFRVDYGTIVAGHMTRPQWDKPIVGISSHRLSHYFSPDVMQAHMLKLGQATRAAIEASGKKVILLASHSLSHRHFTTESAIPEDMSQEHITHHGQYLWDMQMIKLMREGKSKDLFHLIPDFTEHAIAETDSGALSWLLSALQFPAYPAVLHGYGTVIGTGNAIVEWNEIHKGADA